MSEHAKTKSRRKAKAIQNHIAVPEFVWDARLDRFYQDFPISGSDNFVTIFTTFKRWILQRFNDLSVLRLGDGLLRGCDILILGIFVRLMED